EPLIQRRLVMSPGGETGFRPSAEQMLAAIMLVEAQIGRRANDPQRHWRQRDRVGVVVLGSLFGQRPHRGGEIKLGPPDAADLLPPGAKQDQQSKDPAVVIIATGIPDGD